MPVPTVAGRLTGRCQIGHSITLGGRDSVGYTQGWAKINIGINAHKKIRIHNDEKGPFIPSRLIMSYPKEYLVLHLVWT